MERRGFTLIELMIVVVIIGILAAIAVPNFMSMQIRAKEAHVRSNAHTVQLAAEDFSVQNQGVYPASLADALFTGDTVIDLMPGGALLENPFSRLRDSPLDGGPGAAGQIGYLPVDNNGDAIADGYDINGMGGDGATIIVRIVCQ